MVISTHLSSPALVEWLLNPLGIEETSRETEREAKHSIVCRFWLVALQAELCAATHNTAMCPSNSSQESVMRNEYRVGCATTRMDY